MPFLGENNIEDSMRTTASFIHVGGSHCPIEQEQMENLLLDIRLAINGQYY